MSSLLAALRDLIRQGRQQTLDQQISTLYYDLRRNPGDNPVVDMILCAEKNSSKVRYSMLVGSKQLFAGKYRLVLLSEEKLHADPRREADELAESALR